MVAATKALESLLKTVQRNRSAKDGKPNGVVSAVIIFFVVIIATFVFAYASTRKSKELARLRHEKNKRDIETKNAETKRACTENAVEAARLGAEINQIEKEVDLLDEDIAIIEKAMEKDYKAIDAITSWRDIK